MTEQLTALNIVGVEPGAEESGGRLLTLSTDDGPITCRLHDAPAGDSAVLWVFGAGGGLGGPAGGVYPRLARELVPDGVASLEVAYRRLRDLAACVTDVLTGIAYLGTLGRTRIVLVGHSFGGAVVITAGAASDRVIAVAALSSVRGGTGDAPRLSPRPLLLAHGDADEVVPVGCSYDIHDRAREPKQIITYPGCLHGLDQCRDELDRDLLGWLREVTRAGTSG